MATPIPIIGGDKLSPYSDYVDALPVNLIAVTRQISGAEGYLISHDGLSFVGFGQGVDRGGLYNERMRRHFRVSGQKVVEVVADNINIIGDAPGSGHVSFAYSFNSTVVLSSGRLFRYDGSFLSEITDPDLGSPISVTWVDGYYFFTDGENLYHTDAVDETSINPLKFATSEISPDPTKAVGRTQDNLIVAFNRYSTEYFINQANEQFAFTRLNQKAVSSGIVGTHCWCDMDGTLFILGGRKEERVSVHILGAGQTKNISTRHIDKIIASYSESELSDAKLDCRISERDQLLYVRLPGHTLVFNQSIAEKFGISSAWTQLESNDGAYRGVNFVMDVNLNKWVCGDSLSSVVGALDNSTASQYDNPIKSEFYTPLIPIESQSVDELEVNVISGFGQSDVRLFVSTTRDGAIYSQEWSKQAQIPQDYGHRYIVRRLGYVRKNIGFKFRSYHKDKMNVSGLVINHG